MNFHYSKKNKNKQGLFYSGAGQKNLFSCISLLYSKFLEEKSDETYCLKTWTGSQDEEKTPGGRKEKVPDPRRSGGCEREEGRKAEERDSIEGSDAHQR